MLCALMTTPAELLILDEPTNHLDLEGIAFLEDFVQRYRGAVVVVSHDRRFLDATCRSILEVEGGDARLFKGNWSAYAQQRDAAILAQARAYKDQQAWVEKELDYIRRNMAGRMSVQAKGRLKKLQRLQLIDRPKGPRASMRLSFSGGRGQVGQSVLEAKDLRVALPNGRVLVDRASFRLYHGEVLGIVGKNGAGKSTLLRCLLGETAPAGGKIERAVSVRGGFFSQEMQDLPRHGTVLEALRQVDPQAEDKPLRDHLALFLFTGDDAERPVEGLSGGEKRRLCLARLTRGHFDFLCLDEPTNHLDITAREALEEALLEYPGAVLVVSHDRAFVDKLVDRVLLVQDRTVRTFDGGLAQVLATLAQERSEQRAAGAEAREKERQRAERDKPADAAAKAAAQVPGKVRNPLLFQRLEEKIMTLEAEQVALSRQMIEPDNYASREKMAKLLAREQEVKRELADAYARWESWE
jgi:ATP-binding cassette subfamily F protein 3